MYHYVLVIMWNILCLNFSQNFPSVGLGLLVTRICFSLSVSMIWIPEHQSEFYLWIEVPIVIQLPYASLKQLVYVPVVANLYMEVFEKIAIEFFHLKLKRWKRFIDDTNSNWPHSKHCLDEFLENLNNRPDHIKFTMEVEEEKKIPLKHGVWGGRGI